MKNNREAQRCPMCHSKEIYRRIWSKLWADKSKKLRSKDRADLYRKRIKKYRCVNCKSEFDVPLIELNR